MTCILPTLQMRIRRTRTCSPGSKIPSPFSSSMSKETSRSFQGARNVLVVPSRFRTKMVI